MKVALYARVSTDRQETENQLRELREFASRKGWDIYKEYVDEVVRRKDPKPARERLYLDAHQKRFEAVVFWSLDRFVSYDSSNPVKEALDSIARLTGMGIDVISMREESVTTMGPFREIAIAFYSLFSKLEIERDRERIKAGLARARAAGKKLGPPYKDYSAHRDEIIILRSQGFSWSQIAQRTSVPPTSARRLLPKIDYSTQRDTVIALRSQGLSWSEIGQRTGMHPTSARALATIPLENSVSPTHERTEADRDAKGT